MVRVRGNFTPIKQLRIDLEEFSDTEMDSTINTPKPDPSVFMRALEKPFRVDHRTMAPGRGMKTSTPVTSPVPEEAEEEEEEEEMPLDLTIRSKGVCIYLYNLFHH
jgi:hypothetical protein